MKSGVKLTSETGEPDCVTIDAEGQGRIFDCDQTDSTGKIIGFTVTGGHATGSGQPACGGAMWCRNPCAVRVENCLFIENTADMYGGVAYCLTAGAPRFINCTFLYNYADMKGGAILTASSCALTVKNCTFFGNSAGNLGAGIYINSESVIIENTIVAHSPEGEAIYVQEDYQVPTLTCCDLYGNIDGDFTGWISDQIDVNGNFSADPLFCDTLSGDFTLMDCSPCLPSNHPYGYDCGGVIGALEVGCACP
jgi:predicted outer membrane repeat protein